MQSLYREDRVLIEEVECAFSILARMRGLLGRDGLARGRAMYIRPCTGIHTMGMKFPIDVIFLSRDLTVVKTKTDIHSGRLVTGGSGAVGVIEMESGWFPWSELSVGDKVCLKTHQGRALSPKAPISAPGRLGDPSLP